jgi:hypothetical protein
MNRLSGLALLWLAAIVLLIACGGEERPEGPSSTTNPIVAERMGNPKLVHKGEPFEMRLNVEKTTYKEGEPIVLSASLTYTGDEKEFTVWGSSSAKVGFTLTDGKDFDMDGASTSDLTHMKFARGETMEFPFVKSGGYGSDDPDAEFWRAFYAEKELKLPAGQYLIAAHCNFSLTQDVVDSHYDGDVYTTITVVE